MPECGLLRVAKTQENKTLLTRHREGLNWSSYAPTSISIDFNFVIMLKSETTLRAVKEMVPDLSRTRLAIQRPQRRRRNKVLDGSVFVVTPGEDHESAQSTECSCRESTPATGSQPLSEHLGVT
jgi:hypothetical protein